MTAATAGCIELQVTDAVMFCVDPSLIVAIAVSWLMLPRGMNNVAGTTFSATTAAGVTAKFAVPVTDPEAALIVVVPTPLATAAPAGLTLAIAGPNELHVADCVRFCVLPSV